MRYQSPELVLHAPDMSEKLVSFALEFLERIEQLRKSVAHGDDKGSVGVPHAPVPKHLSRPVEDAEASRMRRVVMVRSRRPFTRLYVGVQASQLCGQLFELCVRHLHLLSLCGMARFFGLFITSPHLHKVHRALLERIEQEQVAAADHPDEPAARGGADAQVCSTRRIREASSFSPAVQVRGRVNLGRNARGSRVASTDA